MQRLAALVPRPTEGITEHAHHSPARMSWARLLKRVFEIDIEHYPNCGGALKIIAAIEDAPVIERILANLGLPTRAPPRSPTHRVDFFQAAREPKPLAQRKATIALGLRSGKRPKPLSVASRAIMYPVAASHYFGPVN